jgi:hypothetical protein
LFSASRAENSIPDRHVKEGRFATCESGVKPPHSKWALSNYDSQPPFDCIIAILLWTC